MKNVKCLFIIATLFGISHSLQAATVQVRPDEAYGKLLIVDTQYNDDLTILSAQTYPVLVGTNASSPFLFLWPKYRSESASVYNTFKFVDHWIEGYSVGPSNSSPIQGIVCNTAPGCSSGDDNYPVTLDAYGEGGMWKVINNFQPHSVWFYNLTADIPKRLQTLVSVGETYSHVAHNCSTNEEYDYKTKRQKCADMPNAFWQSVKRSWLKEGHITLKTSPSTTDLTFDSNGNIWPGDSRCVTYTRSGKDGVLCRLLEYNFSSTSSISNYYIQAYLGNSTLMDKISNKDIAITVNRIWWADIGSNYRLSNLIVGDHLEYFISKDVLKQMVAMGLQGVSTDLFRIMFRTSWGAQYETATPTQINLTARKYIVSIEPSAGGTVAYREGIVGKDILDFGYRITESGPSSADKLEIMLQQSSGVPYNNLCTFYRDGAMSPAEGIAIPSKLHFNSGSGGVLTQEIGCNGQPLDLRGFNIGDKTPPQTWDDPVYGKGLTRVYDLSLLFDLTDKMAQHTVSGQQWEGAAQQSGTLTIRATWK